MDDTPHAHRCLCSKSPLIGEASVPVTGFSRELRERPDVERFWFPFALLGEVSLPVHVVFSRSARSAEVKGGDLKAYRLADVSSACEARELWIAWWQRGRRLGGFAPPRRTGRSPGPTPAAS